MTYRKYRLTEFCVSTLEHCSPDAEAGRDDAPVAAELPDDATLMMEVLFDIRRNTDVIIDLLVEDDGEEETGDT